MDRRTFSLSALAFALAPALRAQPARNAEVNAVYACLLSTGSGKCYLEPATYLPDCPSIATREYSALEKAKHVPGAYPNIRPPADRLADAAELIADLKLRLSHAVPIDAHLPTPRPYQLLSAEKVRLYRADAGGSAPLPALSAKQQRQLEALPGILSLAPVGFNHDRTLALTATRWFLSGLHHNGNQILSYGGSSSETWYVLEKRSGSWQRASWPASGYATQA